MLGREESRLTPPSEEGSPGELLLGHDGRSLGEHLAQIEDVHEAVGQKEGGPVSLVGRGACELGLLLSPSAPSSVDRPTLSSGSKVAAASDPLD